MLCKLIFSLVSIFLLCQTSVCQSSNRNNYTIKDGLPSNTIYCVEQDNRGFIWFGTDAGLSRFDGVEYKNYGLQDGLPDMEILNFHKDYLGRIWLYTLNGKVGYVEDGSIYSSANAHFLKNADFDTRITSVRVKNDLTFISSQFGGVKILTDSGLVNEIKVIEPSNNYISIVGDHWYLLESSYKGMFLFTDTVSYNGIHTNPDSIELNGVRISSPFSYVTEVGNEMIGVGTGFESLIACINPFTKTVRTRPINNNRREKLRVYNIKNVDGEVFLLTEKGIKTLIRESLEMLDFMPLPEPTNFIYDKDENMWVSSLNNGVFFVPKIEVERLHPQEIQSVRRLFEHNDNLYLVYNNTIVGKMDSLHQKQDLFPLNDKYVKSLDVDEEGNVWILSANSLRKNGAIYSNEFLNENMSYYKDRVFIHYDNHGFCLLNLKNDQRIDFVHQKIGKIRDYEWIDDDQIILASERGLSLIDLKESSCIQLKEFNKVRILDLALDKYDKLWMATNGYGLLRVNKTDVFDITYDQIKRYRVTNYSDVYRHILIKDSIAYTSNPKGISKILFDSLGLKMMIQKSESAGLEPARINDIEFANEKIYIAQDNGLFSFAHSADFNDEGVFPVFVENISTADSIYLPLNGFISFAYDIGTIRFNVKSIYFKNQDNLRYQFKLTKEGSEDSKWSQSTSRQFLFSNLTPGKYTFHVRARSTNSSWTLPVSQDFEVETIYWQTLWFKIAISLATLTIFFISYQSYVSAKRRRVELNKKKIESDLKALKAQINPHFLFNSLNSIQSFILERNNNLAEDYLVKYGKLMRTILNHSNVLTVFINDEIEATRLYVDLEKLRLGKELDFEIEIINLDGANDKVPSMIIQPLIENSIWHGVQPAVNNGAISLRFEGVGDKTIVTIEDNGSGLQLHKTVDDGKPHGLQLVKERMALINKLYGIKSDFEIISNGQGAKVIFSYPINLN